MEQDTQDMAGSDGVSVHAGFPNPAIDRRGQGSLTLDLNQLLVKHPSSTYLFRIKGHQWVDQGVYDGDIAVIDKAVSPKAGDLIIIWEDGGFQLSRQIKNDPHSQPWGVITSIIHQFQRSLS